MSTITERIWRVYKESGERSVRGFAMNAGINPGTFNDTLKKDNEPRFALLLAILNHCPNVSAEWLMREEGEMYRSSPVASSLDAITGTVVNISKHNTNTGDIVEHGGEVTKADGNLTELLKQQLVQQEEQIREKDKQIREKDEQINKLFGLLYNSQNISNQK